MSGYPDDRSDDRPDPRARDQARSAASIPATLLIVTGVLALIVSVVGLIQLPSLPGKMDDMIAKIDADPNMPADQKTFMKDFFTQVKDVAQGPVMPVAYVASMICAGLVILGGVKLMKLSGPVLPIVSSIFAMIPCTVGGCCLLGLPAGIWALIVINRPEVRAAMAANRSGSPPDPHDQYPR
jgi:hypothetical protein